MADEKIYVGNGISKFDGDQVEFSLDLSNPAIKEHMFEMDGKSYIKLKVNGKNYLKLIVGAKKDGADEYGKTHWVRINTWKPDEKKAAPSKAKAEEEEMPF